MKGGSRKKRRSEPKKRQTKVASNTDSSPATEESNYGPGGDLAIDSKSTTCSLPSTPKRGRRQTGWRQEAYRTSTPVHRSSTVNLVNTESPEAKQADLEYTKISTQLKTSEVQSTYCKTKFQRKRKSGLTSQSRQVNKSGTRQQKETCSETNNPPVKRPRGRPRKIKTGNLQRGTTSQSSERPRPKFELAEECASLLSSDLSIELSHYEEPLPFKSFQEDEESDDEEEEDLPSFLMQIGKKPRSIREGVFVWCKFRNYPFWPALVKSVNHKQKKASVMFVDDITIHRKKGFTVALKTLKPFDCEESKELVCKAKEKYDTAIEWALELITDYGIRIACGSFSGSFIEYFAHDMSYPVRRKYPQAASERPMMEELFDDHKEDSFSEQQEEVSRCSKRLLPDRTHAAHNRANEKLVHFIVKQRMVEGRLLAVICGQQQSRWLRSFLSANRRRVVNYYLEDDKQLDQVYWYLNDLYASAVAPAPCLAEVKNMECVRFVLDVLLPEAIIYAIAGVDNVSLKKAEEKYLKGRCISNRERQEFDLMIDEQMRKKSQNTPLTLFSDSVT